MLGSKSFFDSDSIDSADTIANPELNRRLGLYQLFLKLYEHRRELLDEILNLENSGVKFLSGNTCPYIQGVVLNQQSYLVTNLPDGKTQALRQPQNLWTIGRDSRKVMIHISDKRLSRLHAAIQYCGKQQFQLIDLNSSNGSFINGEPVRNTALLQDGDQIRLGSLTFSFFSCYVEQTLDGISPEILAQIGEIQKTALPMVDRPLDQPPDSSNSSQKLNYSSVYSSEDTLMFLKNKNRNLI